LFYIALEPYVRRLWPESLVSWSRLLMGRFRDPLVGRDLLMGMATLGLLSAGLSWLGGLARQYSGIPNPLALSYLDRGLAGIRYAMSHLVIIMESSIGQAMMFLVILLIFRLMLRRNWIAFLGLQVMTTLVMALTPSPVEWPIWATIIQVLVANLFVATLITCLLRFGLVSVIGGMMMTGAMEPRP